MLVAPIGMHNSSQDNVLEAHAPTSKEAIVGVQYEYSRSVDILRRISSMIDA